VLEIDYDGNKLCSYGQANEMENVLVKGYVKA
jgi:hypothetical protein